MNHKWLRKEASHNQLSDRLHELDLGEYEESIQQDEDGDEYDQGDVDYTMVLFFMLPLLSFMYGKWVMSKLIQMVARRFVG